MFISYCHDDLATAKRFAESLQREGFTVWWDASLRSGEAFDVAIENALRGASAVIVLWSKNSVQSRWVRAEATLADRLKTLVPVMIEPCERPIIFASSGNTHFRMGQTDRAKEVQNTFRKGDQKPRLHGGGVFAGRHG